MFLLFLAHIFLFGQNYAVNDFTSPRFTAITKNVTVVAGDTAVLPCSVINLGSYKIVWQSPRSKTLTLEERRIISDDRISLERPYKYEWNLHIREVKTADTGTYQCQINTDPVQARPIKLIVQEPAKIIEHLSTESSVTVMEGETVELVCNVTGLPSPTVTWYRVPTGLMEDGNTEKKQIGMEGEVLFIHNVSRYCDDEYECVAFNGVAYADSRKIRVNVQFPPEVRLPNKKIGQSIGLDTILECQVTAFPLMENVWSYNGVSITKTTRKYSIEVYTDGANKITLMLKILHLTKEDYGQYKCLSRNNLGYDAEVMTVYEYKKRKATTTATTTTTTTTVRRKDDYRTLPRTHQKPDRHWPDESNPMPWNRQREREQDPHPPNVVSGDDSIRNPDNGYDSERVDIGNIGPSRYGRNENAATNLKQDLACSAMLMMFSIYILLR